MILRASRCCTRPGPRGCRPVLCLRRGALPYWTVCDLNARARSRAPLRGCEAGLYAEPFPSVSEISRLVVNLAQMREIREIPEIPERAYRFIGSGPCLLPIPSVLVFPSVQAKVTCTHSLTRTALRAFAPALQAPARTRASSRALVLQTCLHLRLVCCRRPDGLDLEQPRMLARRRRTLVK